MVTETKSKTRIQIDVPVPHPHQLPFVQSTAKRKVIRAGRRGGKTVGAVIMAALAFIMGRRVLYTAPTSEQTDAFWFLIKVIFQPLVATGVYKLNETERYIEKVGTLNRIKAKTAWDADSLRGDYADLLLFDEYQLTNEDAWEVVGAPLLIDNNGDAVFIYTPPSLRSAGVSKARDPRHAAKMFKMAQADTSGRWAVFHFTSRDNPHTSQDALNAIIKDMSKQSYRQEILAEDDELQLSWLVYRAFNEATCKIPRFFIDDNWPRYVFHDFGAANPAALVVAQNPGTGDFIVEREYLPGAGRAIPQRVEDLRLLTARSDGKPMTILGRYGGNHAEEEIRQGYGAHGWPIAEPKLTKPNAQIDRVIGMMELNKIKVFDDCLNYLEELMNCLWLPDNEGKPTDKIKDEAKYHLSAAARYGFSNFVPETVSKTGYRTNSASWSV